MIESANVCPDCLGDGRILVSRRWDEGKIYETCAPCGGSGEAAPDDPSDAIVHDGPLPEYSDEDFERMVA